MGRVLKGSKKYTYVAVMDEPGAGGANHSYKITESDSSGRPQLTLGEVHFQNGPIKENGVNGVMNEDLLAIIIDRLEGFQNGDFKCRENAIALTHLETAMLWLRKRTMDREERGVEGTSTV